MEDRFSHDFDEEEKEQRRRERPRRILLVAFALLMASAAAGAYFVRGAGAVPSWALATPSPSPTAAPVPTKTPAAPEETPISLASPDAAFLPTAIYVDGVSAGAIASEEAARALISDVTAYFELLASAVGIPDTQIENDIEFKSAGPEETASLSTYETLYAYFTGEDTPLTVVTTLTSQSVSNVPCETKSETTKYLIKGTRLILSMGRDGATHTVTVTRFVNGVQDGEPETATAVISRLIDASVLEGSAAVDRGAEPGKKEGERGPDAGSLVFNHPTAAKRITRNFGQYHGVLHLGLDYAVSEGDEVLASCDGTVVCAMERGGYGLMIEIDHGGGFVTRYAHLSAINVALGDAVAAGDVIGLAGSTGNCDGPVLHFELRSDGIAYNPRFYLR